MLLCLLIGNQISVELEVYVFTLCVLHTVAVRVLAERSESYSEWWFASKVGRFSTDVRLVYRSDYVSESVAAEWAAEELTFPVPAEAENSENREDSNGE